MNQYCLVFKKSCLKLAKDADSDKYSYSGYGIGFNTRTEFPLPDDSASKNANKRKDILIFGKIPTQELDNTALRAENIQLIL